MSRSLILVVAIVFAAVAGCTRETKETTQPAGPDASGQKYLLSQEPAGAKGVAEVRKGAKDGDEVVVVGRIGGSKDPWLEGRASFTIVDPALKSCLGDGCPTPWDYCCTPDDELSGSTVSVKVVDDNGRTIGTDARQLLGLKELEIVVVKGKVRREGEAFFIQASGLHVRPEAKP